jgi:DNA-binding winged helix-turn-helix (wHTH) protein/tetratricopeptide (TPR) repeat protein
MNSLRLRFGEFQLDPARRELRRNGELVTLPLKVFESIAYLAAHRDRAVGRDELIAAVWGRVEVASNLLDQTMLRARRALGDTDGDRRIIRTVLGFGYAWVAPTEIVEIGAEDSQPTQAERADATPTESTAPISRSRARSGRPVLLGSIALLVVGALLWSAFILRDKDAGKADSARPQLALLLPVTLSADSKFAWARLGAMDLIAERLRAAGQPMVPSDNVVALARGLRSATPDAGELENLVDAAAARMVLQASAELSAGYWRVTVQSIYGRDPPLLAEGESQDLMEAARAAGDSMAGRLGFSPAASDDLVPPRERALAGVLQQVEAAMLADQPDTARALLDTLDAEQSQRPEVRYRRAGIDFRSGRLDAAEADFKALLESTSAKDDPLFRARLLNGLGNIALRRDDYAATERNADAVIELLGESKPSPELGRALTGRGIAQSAQYRFDPALVDFARARVVLESVGDRLGLARVDVNLGILDARRDRYAEALPVLMSSAQRLAAFHDLTSELFARVTAAYAQLALLEPAAALAGESRLRELVMREPNPQWKRYTRLALAEVLFANGRLADAKALLGEVLVDAEQADDAPILASARIVAARFSLASGDAAAASRSAGDVLKTSWEAETPREQALAWLTLVRAHVALGQTADASAAAADARAWAERRGAAAARMVVDLAIAESAAATDDAEQAVAAFERALAEAERGRVPDDLLKTCAAYADYLIATRDLSRAGAVAARVAGWADRSYEAALVQAALYLALDQPAPLRTALSHARNLAGERPLPSKFDDAPMADL